MRIFHPADIELKLPPGHRFPASKYGKLRRRLLDDQIIEPDRLIASPHAKSEDIEVAHDAAYVASIIDGSVSASAMRRIGFPWSPETWTRAAATMGGAVAAARAALEDGISGQISGGTHHAHYNFGAGYCVFNDLAIAALTLLPPSPVLYGRGAGGEGTQSSSLFISDKSAMPSPGASRHPLPLAGEGRIERIAIVDLDVHQGDGTAAMLGGRNDVFTFSMHGKKNFPFRKERSTLDVELDDGVEDDDYLRALAEHLPAVFAFRPDLILFQAGVDPLAEDRLGRMALTHEGLMARDRMVLEGANRCGIPVSIALGGGYADPIEASVEAYANTWRVARRLI